MHADTRLPTHFIRRGAAFPPFRHGHGYRRRSLSLLLILINPVFLDRTVDGGGALVLLLLRQSLQQAPAQESVNGTDSAHV
jgi:hypothetical protein